MKKSTFQAIIKPHLKETDKAWNRQVWNDMLDSLSKSGEKVSFDWVKTPKRLYGE